MSFSDRKLRGKVSSILITFLVLFFGSCNESLLGPLPDHVPEMRGFSYTSFASDGFRQGNQHNAIEDLKTQTASSWIALCVFEYQRHQYSLDIAPNKTGINPATGGVWSTTSTEDDIRAGVSDARAKLIAVMLKPQVDLYNGEWRATIHPDAGGLWFSSYTAMMIKYARLAEELHIEMLCIGTEYVFASQHNYASQWRSLIAAVRNIYTGKLIYAANWNGDYADGLTTPEFKQVEFWNDLDYIGVDAYYPLTNSAGDSIPAFETAVANTVSNVQEIRAISSLHYRQVVITETGIQSVHGALAAPWDYSLGASNQAVQDNQAQQFYYRVMIEAIGKEPWCNGMFWWNWESIPSINESTNYTPQNKPAAETLRQWYSTTGSSIATKNN